MEVLFFGQLTDITQSPKLTVAAAADTDTILQQLHTQFPALASATYVVAVNGQVIQHNTPLEANTTMALLPPFSGG